MRHIAHFIAGILAIDFTGFLLWIASSQLPASDIYIGVITKNLLTLII